MTKERARAGAEFLDQVYPEWHQRIDLDTLEINDYQTCMIGQLFGSYIDGKRILELDSHEAVDFGFAIDPRYEEELNGAWKREVQVRLSMDRVERLVHA